MTSLAGALVRVPVRRYLFWIAYDGSRFPEMARGGTGFGVMDLLKQLVTDSLFGVRPHTHPHAEYVKLSPSSRTDAHVHALRNAVICQVPEEWADLDATLERRDELMSRWCSSLDHASPGGGLRILDMHRVSAGFCCRRSVAYRRYTYRIAVCRDWSVWESLRRDPSTVCFSEQHYAWLLPPGFDPHRAQTASDMFKGTNVMGSFFKHTLREKRQEPVGPNALKHIYHIGVEKGEPYSMDNDLYDYYNVTIVAKSFVREQIRRMMSCIVHHAYDRLPLSTITWLLNNPISSNFFDRRIPVAPPQGLFLTDVVYDAKQFTRPVPYYYHSWDYAIETF